MKKLVLYILTLALCVGVVSAAGGFGLSPSIMQEEELVRGQTYTKSLKILSSEETEREVLVNVTGDAADWIVLKDPDTNEEHTGPFIVPAKGERFVLVEIPVPADQANGIYKGYFSVESTTIDDPKVNQVRLVVRTTYTFGVTGDERKEGRVASVVAEDTESGQVARVKYDFQNTGNVAFAPLAELRIQNADGIVDTVELEGEVTRPGEQIVQIVEWDTEGRGTGDFTAFATISVDGQQLGNGQADFEILPRGTFTAEYIAGAPALPSNLVVDKLTKGTLSFTNTGQIDLLAKVRFEVMQDGELVDVVSSEETLVTPNGVKELEFFFKPTSEGEYVLEGTLLYSGREEALEPLEVTVLSAEDAATNTEDFDDGGEGNMLLWIGAGVIVLLIVVILFLVFRKK